jgi:stage II sporulation protein D
MLRLLRGIIFLTLSLCLLLFGWASADSLSSVDVDSAPLVTQSSAMDGMVRVYLSSLGSPSSLTLTISGSYSLSDGTTLSSGETLTVSFNSTSGALTLTRNGTAYSMGKSFTLRRHTTTGSNGIKIAQARKPDNLYPGDLEFEAVSVSGGYKLYTIAHIYIENYLYGVVPYEMGSSAPLEALKAQAVAARTYTVRMMNSRASALYDVVDTTGDQTYNGTPSTVTNCNTAVDKTKGIILKNGSAYTATYYSSSNGGQTESIKNAWGTSGYSYLDVHDDPFDYANPDSVVKQSTVYQNASSSYNNASLITLLKSKAVAALQLAGYNATTSNTALQTIQDITPTTPKYASPSRLYTKMDFTLTLTTYNASSVLVSVTTTVTCDIFNELESMLTMSIQSGSNELWTVVDGSGSFAIQARRYGHGIGMSQRGAMYMGQLGFTYDEILGFYYVDSTRVGCTFTNTILSAGSSEVITTDEDPVSMDDDTGIRGIVALGSGTQLAVRNAQSATASVLTVIDNSTPVTVLANYGSWCKIKYGSIVGYVPTSALTITGTAPTSDDTAVSAIDGYAVVTSSSYLNLRQSASYSATILSTAPGGAILTVISWGTDWAYIQYGKLTAYAATDFLSFSSSYPESISETDTDGESGDAMTAVVSTGEGSLNMRQQAKAGSTVLTTIPQGATVTVTQLGTTWSAVTYFGYSGYVMTTYLSFESGGDTQTDEQTGDQYAKVTTESGSLNLRQQAKAGSSIYCTIPQYGIVVVHSLNADWSQVTYNGITGYVMTAFLTIVDASEAEAAQDTDADQGGESDATDGETGDTQDETTIDGPTAIVTTASGSLNLRFDALPGSRVLIRIPQGATIPVLEKMNTWTYTKYQDICGYVMNAYLTFSDSGDNTQQATATPAPTATPMPTQPPSVVTAWVNTPDGSLNLRTAPNGSVLASIPQYAQVTVLSGFTETWCKTQYGSYTGYTMSKYLTTTEPEQKAYSVAAWVNTPDDGSLNLRNIPNGTLVAVMPQHAQVTALTDIADTWCQIQYGSLTGYTMSMYLMTTEPGTAAQPTPTPAPSDDVYPISAWVNTSDDGSLNLRKTPGGSVLVAIPQSAQVDVLSDMAETWCKLAYGTATGYAMSAYLTTTEPQPTATPAGSSESDSLTAWVNTPEGSLNLRNAPNGSVLLTIPQYAQIAVITSLSDTWCRIQYNGVTGYTVSRYLTTTKPSQAEDTAQTGDGTTGVTAWVNTPDGSLNLRSAPNGSLIATIPQYAQVLALSSLSETWCKTKYGDITGYTVSKYLSTTKPTQTAASTASPDSSDSSSAEKTLDPTLREVDKEIIVYVRPPAGQATLKLYDECLENATVLKSMPEDSEVEIIQAGDTWCEVLYDNNQKGYCLRDGLSFFEE